MRLIDADAFKEQLEDAYEYTELAEVIEMLDNAPTVDLTKNQAYDKGFITAMKAYSRPQGEWARHDEWVGGVYVGGFYHVNCPCENGYYSKWEYNFCPNCGLPMRKGGAE